MSHPEFSTEPFFYEEAAERRQGGSRQERAAKVGSDENAWERPLKRVQLRDEPTQPETLDQPLTGRQNEPPAPPSSEPAKARRRRSGMLNAFAKGATRTDLKNLRVLSHAFCFMLGFAFSGAIAFWYWPIPAKTPATVVDTSLPPLPEQAATLIQDDPLRTTDEPPADNPGAGIAATTMPTPSFTPSQSPPAATAASTASDSMWKPHRIKPGETVRHLSAKYDTDENEIYLRNGGRFVPRVGQVILLPGRSFKTHTVQRGDSLHVIAKKYSTDVASLQELNGLSGTNIKVGLPLRVM